MEEMILFWDKAIAYFIGSIDGLPVVGAVNPGGDTDGVLIYALANHCCKKFQMYTHLVRAFLIMRYQDILQGEGIRRRSAMSGVERCGADGETCRVYAGVSDYVCDSKR